MTADCEHLYSMYTQYTLYSGRLIS